MNEDLEDAKATIRAMATERQELLAVLQFALRDMEAVREQLRPYIPNTGVLGASIAQARAVMAKYAPSTLAGVPLVQVVGVDTGEDDAHA